MREIVTSEKVTVSKRKPLIIEEVFAEKIVIPRKSEKKVYNKIPVPEGHVRVIVLKEYEGMLVDRHEVGDIVDLPDRRFKTLVTRGIVREYKGNKEPGDR